MRIGLLSYYLASKHSGQTRFLINISKGLKSIGHTPIVYSLYIDQEVSRFLMQNSIKHISLEKIPNKFTILKTIPYSKTPAKSLSNLVKDNNLGDVYVVLADEAISVVNYLSNFKTAYISNGDLALLFLNPEFKRKYMLASVLLERKFIKQIRTHAKIVSRFDKIMANSDFTSNLMAFLYGTPIDKVVYPPVDRSVFNNFSFSEPKNSYTLALIRNEVEPTYLLVDLIANNLPVKVVGGGEVKNAVNLGFVSESELVKLYNLASFTISPSVVEFYGYGIVESMSCGTPSIAYNNAGARELIKHGENGWLFSSKDDLLTGAKKLFYDGYDSAVRENCLKYSEKYSISESAHSLISIIKDI